MNMIHTIALVALLVGLVSCGNYNHHSNDIYKGVAKTLNE